MREDFCPEVRAAVRYAMRDPRPDWRQRLAVALQDSLHPQQRRFARIAWSSAIIKGHVDA